MMLMSKDFYVADLDAIEDWMQFLDFCFQALEYPENRSELWDQIERTKSEIIEKEYEAAQQGILLATRQLRTCFRLSDFFWGCTLLSVAGEFDEEFSQRIAALQGDMRKTIPQARLAQQLFFREDILLEDLQELSREDSNFQRFFLSPDTPRYGFFEQMFVPDRRILQYLLGERRMPDSVRMYLTCWPCDARIHIDGIYMDEIHRCCQAVAATQDHGSTTVILHLFGSNGPARRRVIMESCVVLKLSVYFLDLRRLSLEKTTELRRQLDLIIRETLLGGAVLCVENIVNEGEPWSLKNQLVYVLTCLSHYLPFFFMSSEERLFIENNQHYDKINLEIPEMTVDHRIKLWMHYIQEAGISNREFISELSGKFYVTEDKIRNTVHELLFWKKCDKAAQPTSRDFEQAIKNQNGLPMGTSATLINSHFTMDDIILEPSVKQQLVNIINQLKYGYTVWEKWGFYKKVSYGRGICVLFYGSPGTGKTMAAQVVANELGYDLYRVDISQIISKYIGETEKNISMLFSRAKNQNIVLFFDEADALFAKRLDVNSSNDRNANAETAYLLQQIEDYEGVTILATNFANNIDAAFKRRIRHTVNFITPSQDLRRKLWRNMMPEEAECAYDLDMDFFADQFELSGSNIREIVLNSAFLAAAENCPIGNEHLMQAICYYYRKIGKNITRDEFGPYAYFLF